MIDQIAQKVSEKTGLSEDMSKTAVQVVIDQLKDRLPAPVAAQLDSYVSGEGSEGGVAGMAKGLFGG